MNKGIILMGLCLLLSTMTVNAAENFYRTSSGQWVRINANVPYDVTKTARTYNPHASIPGAAAVTEQYDVRTPGGKIPVTLNHTLPKGAVSKAAGGLLKFAGPVGAITNAISLGMLVWDATQAKWVLPQDGYSTNEGYYQGYKWRAYATSGPYYDSADLACKNHYTNYYGGVIGTPSPTATVASCYPKPGVGGPNGSVQRIACASTDTLMSCTPGATPPALPATDGQIEQAISDGIGNNSNAAAAVAEAAENGGYEALAEGVPSASGPTTVQGPTTTIVNSTPQGDITINESVTYNITYAGDVVTVGSTTTTTTTGPDGATSTQTKTETPPPGGATQTGSGGGWPVKLPDDYAREKTTQGILSKLTETFTWLKEPLQPEPLPALPEPPIEEVVPPAGIGDLNSYLTDLNETAACPNDYTISILSANVTIPMGPFCDLADLARPLNIIFFTIFAMLAFFRIYST